MQHIDLRINGVSKINDFTLDPATTHTSPVDDINLVAISCGDTSGRNILPKNTIPINITRTLINYTVPIT